MPRKIGMRIFYSDRDLIAELRRAARLVKGRLSMRAFLRASERDPATFKQRFGSWRQALAAAGLAHRAAPPGGPRRFSWRACHANLAALWRHLGRAPRRAETRRPPSRIGWQSYVARFGSWRAALDAFLAARRGHKGAWPRDPGLGGGGRNSASAPAASGDGTGAGDGAPRRGAWRQPIPPRLRHGIMQRDRFRCVLCGANPAADPAVTLHLDHIVPLAKGGTNAADNLRTLCAACNLGKGADSA